MQKFVKIYRPNDYELEDLIKKNLVEGWIVKQMVVFSEDNVLFLLEKETRKDKLDRLDEISKT